MPGDFNDDEPAVTLSAPACERHPPLDRWPTRNLIERRCYVCGHGVADQEDRFVRQLRARRLIRERGDDDDG